MNTMQNKMAAIERDNADLHAANTDLQRRLSTLEEAHGKAIVDLNEKDREFM